MVRVWRFVKVLRYAVIMLTIIDAVPIAAVVMATVNGNQFFPIQVRMGYFNWFSLSVPLGVMPLAWGLRLSSPCELK